MGFWGTLGKGLLKAAPIAASFIPGVGPLASMGIGAATGAAGGALGGGGIKGAIMGGASGAASGKGIGPSNPNVIMNAGQRIGNVAQNVAKNYLTPNNQNTQGISPMATYGPGNIQGQMPQQGGGGIGNFLRNNAGKIAGAATAGAGAYLGARAMNNNNNGNNNQPFLPPRSTGGPEFAQQMRRGLGPVMGQIDQNNPNLAESIGAGRLEAIRNQPFRAGYDVNSLGNDDETVIKSRTPPIFSGGRSSWQDELRRKQQAVTQ